jgi:hypothetical protein
VVSLAWSRTVLAQVASSPGEVLTVQAIKERLQVRCHVSPSPSTSVWSVTRNGLVSSAVSSSGIELASTSCRTMPTTAPWCSVASRIVNRPK